jgi:hypothetical protein
MSTFWLTLRFFCNAALLQSPEQSLHKNFESQLVSWTEDYEEAHQTLLRDYFLTRHQTDPRVVSDAAKDYRKLAAFCLARFVECHKEGVMYKEAACLIAKEVVVVQDWDNQVLLESILEFAKEAAGQRTLRALRYLIIPIVSIIVALIIGLFPPASLHTRSIPEFDFPSATVREGIWKWADQAESMSKVAENITVIDALLSHSRRSVMGLWSFVGSTRLQNKDLFITEYEELEKNMGELISLLRRYNGGVPMLITQFGSHLSIVLSRVQAIDTSSFNLHDSILVKGSEVLSILCFNNFISEAGRTWSYFWACGAMFLVSDTLSTCISISTSTLSNHSGSLCKPIYSTLLALNPGMEIYQQQSRQNKTIAVSSLLRFLEVLAANIGELHRIADAGAGLCTMMEAQFRSITTLKQTSVLEIESYMDGLNDKLWSGPEPGWIERTFSSGDKRSSERDKTYKAWRVAYEEANHLNQMQDLHSASERSLLIVTDVLEDWERDIQTLLKDVRVIEKHLKEHREHVMFFDEVWEKFKDDVEGLRPILKNLVDIQERQKLRNRTSRKFWEDRSAECLKKVGSNEEAGETMEWDNCFFKGLVINMM